MTLIHVNVETEYGKGAVVCFEEEIGREPDFAMVFGDISCAEPILTRIQSECITGLVFRSLSCDCGDQLRASIEAIKERGCGIVVYLRQEGRGIGLKDKLRSYLLQQGGLDTVEANLALGHPVDPRDYSFAVRILNQLGVSSIDLLTNNPNKGEYIAKSGIQVRNTLRIPTKVRAQNRRYLTTKKDKMGHHIDVISDDLG